MKAFFAIRPLSDIKLKQAMAGCERHLRQISGVPSGDDQTAGKRIALDFLHDTGNLVDDMPVRGLPRAPLLAVDRSEIAVLVGPFVPNADALRPSDRRYWCRRAKTIKAHGRWISNAASWW